MRVAIPLVFLFSLVVTANAQTPQVKRLSCLFILSSAPMRTADRSLPRGWAAIQRHRRRFSLTYTGNCGPGMGKQVRRGAAGGSVGVFRRPKTPSHRPGAGEGASA
jgi:hypothetical protein